MASESRAIIGGVGFFPPQPPLVLTEKPRRTRHVLSGLPQGVGVPGLHRRRRTGFGRLRSPPLRFAAGRRGRRTSFGWASLWTKRPNTAIRLVQMRQPLAKVMLTWLPLCMRSCGPWRRAS